MLVGDIIAESQCMWLHSTRPHPADTHLKNMHGKIMEWLDLSSQNVDYDEFYLLEYNAM
jgi:hypothetical protein